MTIEYLYGHEEQLIPWALERIEGAQFWNDAKAIGIARGGIIDAAVIYDEFSASGCSLAIASNGNKRWLTREFLYRAFAYPFFQCHMRRVGSLVSVNNRAACKLNLGIGMKVEGRIRQAGQQGEDMIAFGMLRNECRFI